MTTVFNLATQEHIEYSCTPAEAVVAAYAQARKDWNTWQYQARYGHLLTEGQYSVACGDFAALKENTPHEVPG